MSGVLLLCVHHLKRQCVSVMCLGPRLGPVHQVERGGTENKVNMDNPPTPNTSKSGINVVNVESMWFGGYMCHQNMRTKFA